MADGTPIIIKKKKSHGHAHHGGAWKVAYADFVTAMMAFFLVMWILGLSSDERQAIAGYFNDPLGDDVMSARGRMSFLPEGASGSSNGSGEGEGSATIQGIEKKDAEGLQVSLTEKLLEESTEGQADGVDLEKLLANVKVHMTDEGLEIEFVDNTGVVFFELGSDQLRPEARRIVTDIAPVLADTGRMMRIDGHTDARPFPGNPNGNWDLSTRRALALQRALTAGGVKPSQIEHVAGHADTNLRFPESPLDARNRRVTVLVPYKLAEDIVLDDLPADALKRENRDAYFRPVGVSPSEHP